MVTFNSKSGTLNPALNGLYLLMRQMDHHQIFTRSGSWPDPSKDIAYGVQGWVYRQNTIVKWWVIWLYPLYSVHGFQPAFTVVLNTTFFNTYLTWEGPVISWPQLLLQSQQLGAFDFLWGSWVVIHMIEHSPEGWGTNSAEYFLRNRSITQKTSNFL